MYILPFGTTNEKELPPEVAVGLAGSVLPTITPSTYAVK
jgi:hypothetical protein